MRFWVSLVLMVAAMAPLSAQRLYRPGSAGVMLPYQSTVLADPVDATTYFIGQMVGGTGTVTNVRSLVIPGGVTTITEVSGSSFHTTAAVSANALTVRLRRNGDSGTDTTIGTYTLNTTAESDGTSFMTRYRFTGLQYPVAADDRIEVVVVTPTWATEPTNLIWFGHIVVRP